MYKRCSAILMLVVPLTIIAVHTIVLRGDEEIQVKTPRLVQEKRKPTAEDYEGLFRLADGEFVRRLPPPFPASRMAYYRTRHAGQAGLIPRGPGNIFFRWTDGNVKNWGISFGSGEGAGLPTILRMLADVYPQEIVADDDVKKLRIPGDFIVDVSASRQRIVENLEQVLNEQMDLNLTIAAVDVRREVYVARGEYTFVPINPQRPRIEIYGDKLNRDPSVGGGGSGDFVKFLDWVGMWIGETVVSDVQMPPTERISWHYNLDGPFTEEEQRRAKDPESVLKNVTLQTGIVFEKQRRKVPSVVVERN